MLDLPQECVCVWCPNHVDHVFNFLASKTADYFYLRQLLGLIDFALSVQVGDLDASITNEQLRIIFRRFGPLYEKETVVKKNRYVSIEKCCFRFVFTSSTCAAVANLELDFAFEKYVWKFENWVDVCPMLGGRWGGMVYEC